MAAAAAAVVVVTAVLAFLLLTVQHFEMKTSWRIEENKYTPRGRLKV